jgi:HAD superfamily hydrolase (TIGR01509 family)
MMPAMLEEQTGVIFDLDGTLVASEILYFRATEQILEPLGRSLRELTALERSHIPGRAAVENMRFYCQRFGLSETPESLAGTRMDQVCRILEDEGVVLLPGAMEFVAGLRAAGFRLAVASSSPGRYVRRVLEVTGLGRYFDAVRSGDDVTRYKPDPEIFDLARVDLALPPTRCVVVEDAYSGILAGQAAGMKVLAVKSRDTLPEQSALADRVVSDFVGLGPGDIKAMLNGSP